MSNFATQYLYIMLEALITSKTRIKLLTKFFLNSEASAYLRSLENEFGDSTNAIRLELNRFEDAGLLKSETKGNKKMFRANTHHPLFNEIHNLVLKHFGFDQIIENIIEKLGSVSMVFIIGDFAKGKNSDIIDLVLIGENINKNYLIDLVDKAEQFINRKIRNLVFTPEEYEAYYKNKNEHMLLLWKTDK